MSQTPIIELRVIQDLIWVKDMNAGWIQVPAQYEIQYQREGSNEWEKLQIVYNLIDNPDKDAEDAAGGEAVDRTEVCDGRSEEEQGA